jgi:hypothetical protein
LFDLIIKFGRTKQVIAETLFIIGLFD